ncbi:calcium/sodium antiporter [Thiomicrospira microaerophila]|uniref:calcium/sodium antiporter n=1 Tax=Thiomicrospira microaerophila TaxID=406020 RepID=UPI00200DCDB0|nr:calcium/sodium antiporter [Thiomicrospira microaerophila]UQB42924.1 calcium/sodium antiporter [Thiomicrospira microaerophila]
MSTVLILPTIMLIVGLALLVWSSDFFIDGAASTAVRYNVSPIIIGAIIIGFGTSSPEIVVAIIASLEGNPGLAVGNAVGSNITNIGLVLGVTALITSIAVKSNFLRREMPILLIITALTVVLMMDYKLGVLDGIILLAILAMTLTWIIRRNKNIAPNDPLATEINQELEELPKLSKTRSFVYLIGGLVLLVISARMMVWGAVEIAEFFEVPDLIIGLTIIAIGTSLPELAASISAALKGEVDMMIGNILGSNLFNLLAVLAVPAILAPSLIDNDLLKRDLPILLGFTVAMLLVALPRKGNATIYRAEGVFLLTLFFGYLTLLYFNTVS